MSLENGQVVTPVESQTCNRRIQILVARARSIGVLLLPGCEVGRITLGRSRAACRVQVAAHAHRAGDAIPAEWWQLYHDAALDQLIATANESNQNLRQAIARVDQARALARVAASYLLPTVTADPSFHAQRAPPPTGPA